MRKRKRKLDFIKQYFELKKVMMEAHRWVKANDKRIPARCMFYLNRLVGSLPRSERREVIYALKSALVKQFYQSGFCRSVSVHIQELSCWHTEGYNNGYYDECPKCYNTGVYASHKLYQFVFDIRGRTYVWHQPVSLVDFPIQDEQADQDPTPYKPGRKESTQVLREQETLYLATVYQYLRLAGIPDNELPQFSLREALYRQWRHSVIQRWNRLKWRYRYEVRPKLGFCRGNISRLWHFIRTGEMLESLSGSSEDEIPF